MKERDSMGVFSYHGPPKNLHDLEVCMVNNLFFLVAQTSIFSWFGGAHGRFGAFNVSCTCLLPIISGRWFLSKKMGATMFIFMGCSSFGL